MKFNPFQTFESTNEGAGTTTEAPKFNAKEFLAKFKDADVVQIATAMATSGSDEEKYHLSKLLIERTKTNFIDPMKEIREKERADEAKAAEERAKVIAEYRDRLNTIVSEEMLEDIAEVAADFIEAGHGQVIQVEIFAKKDPETGKVKAEFSSNIARPRARTGVSSRTRDTGATGAGVTVEGSPKEGVTGPTIPRTVYKSFAAAAKELGFVDDSTNMKGLNCKRLLESKGYTCDYVPAAEGEAAQAPAAAQFRSR